MKFERGRTSLCLGHRYLRQNTANTRRRSLSGPSQPSRRWIGGGFASPTDRVDCGEFVRSVVAVTRFARGATHWSDSTVTLKCADNGQEILTQSCAVPVRKLRFHSEAIGGNVPRQRLRTERCRKQVNWLPRRVNQPFTVARLRVDRYQGPSWRSML